MPATGSAPDSRLEIITGDLGTPADLQAAFRGADAACVALGSIGPEGNLARLAILAAGRAALPQPVRLSVLNTSLPLAHPVASRLHGRNRRSGLLLRLSYRQAARRSCSSPGRTRVVGEYVA